MARAQLGAAACPQVEEARARLDQVMAGEGGAPAALLGETLRWLDLAPEEADGLNVARGLIESVRQRLLWRCR